MRNRQRRALDRLIHRPEQPGVSLRWATVDSLSPLTVTVDGPNGGTTLAGSPSTLVDPVADSRVMVAMRGRRATIIGTANGEVPALTIDDINASLKTALAQALGPLIEPYLTVTTSVVAVPSSGSGFSRNYFHSWRMGPLVSWMGEWERTGSDLNADSNGNLGDTVIATFDTDWAWEHGNYIINNFETGYTSGGARLDSSGNLKLTDANTSSTIANGHNVRVLMPFYIPAVYS